MSTEVWDAHKAAIQDVKKLPTGELVTGTSILLLSTWYVHVFYCYEGYLILKETVWLISWLMWTCAMIQLLNALSIVVSQCSIPFLDNLWIIPAIGGVRGLKGLKNEGDHYLQLVQSPPWIVEINGMFHCPLNLVLILNLVLVIEYK